GFKGGVHLCDTPDQAADLAAQMLGQVLVTHQTGPEGKEVSKVFVGEAVDITRELYVAILLDRATSAPVVIASTEGGVDIETVAEETPGKILRVLVDPTLGLMPF
ncbi:MAG: ATP-grasp domain-containing protein, partial [Chthoniobacterales bacterium]